MCQRGYQGKEQAVVIKLRISITVGKATFAKRVDNGTVLLQAISKNKMGDTSHIGIFKGFEISAEKTLWGPII